MADGPFASLDVSASALAAERLRMNVIAGNIANARTERTPDGGPYVRRLVVFEPLLDRAVASLEPTIPHGVKTRVALDLASKGEVRHEPGNPNADANGDVRLPNVDPILEMVDLLTAARSYEANLTAMKTYREMVQRTIQLGK